MKNLQTRARDADEVANEAILNTCFPYYECFISDEVVVWRSTSIVDNNHQLQLKTDVLEMRQEGVLGELCKLIFCSPRIQ